MGILGAIARHLDAVVGIFLTIPGVMLLFPLYGSMRAIESPSIADDDQKWLTYWVLYSFVTLFELSFWKILQWLPFWPYMKLMLCVWLVLPMFNGAAYIYENFVRKYVNISNYISRPKKVLQMMSLDARKSVERYIDRHGPEAFDRIVEVVT
ncbi:HVA22-like protein f [Primulina eburnea]|uniref:HVA22-like protein f n=1 Tax=Primulina eburnea TaxID=1245227 RepID=UPI003C6C6F40